jgi:filamentous hemagglutinin
MEQQGCTAPYDCPDLKTLDDFWQVAQRKAQALEAVYPESWLLDAKAALDLGKWGVKALSSTGTGSLDALAQLAKVDAAKLVNNSRRDDAQQFVNNNAPIQVPNTVTRNDNDFSSTVNHKGSPKAHIDENGNLVSANPSGKGTPTAHVSGSNPGNTPYISTTDAASVDPMLGGPKTYGSQQTTVNTRDLQRDINSGTASQAIKIINNQQLVDQLQNKVGAAQRKFDANPSKTNSDALRDAQRDLNAAKRDGEVLVTPFVPPAYYSKPTGPVTPIVPVPKPPSPPTTAAQPIK